MPILQWDVIELPETPLDAAADFYATDLPEIRDDSDIHTEHDIALVFAPAPHEHRGWRLAAVQELARELAPRRVNGIVGTNEDAIVRSIAFLDAAPGVTGQLLAVD
jgi:hypothetical protein